MQLQVLTCCVFEHKEVGTWEQSANCQKPIRFDLRAVFFQKCSGGACPQAPLEGCALHTTCFTWVNLAVTPQQKILYETLASNQLCITACSSYNCTLYVFRSNKYIMHCSCGAQPRTAFAHTGYYVQFTMVLP